jgi:hypothetical protein
MSVTIDDLASAAARVTATMRALEDDYRARLAALPPAGMILGELLDELVSADEALRRCPDRWPDDPAKAGETGYGRKLDPDGYEAAWSTCLRRRDVAQGALLVYARAMRAAAERPESLVLATQVARACGEGV